MVEPIISELKKTVVYIGNSVKGSIKFIGTGFRFSYKDKNFLITAKHVILDEVGNVNYNLRFYFNTIHSGKIGSRSFEELKSEEKFEWVFHNNPEVDIAIIPILSGKEELVKSIPDTDLKSIDKLTETQDVISISYQPRTVHPKTINPVIRSGIISQINNDKKFLVDGSSFPGNSGSPIFLKTTILTKTYSDIKKDERPKLIGVVGAYVPYQDIAISQQTGKPRVIFEENTGLSVGWSIDYLEEIFKTEKFQNQFKITNERKDTEIKLTRVPYKNMS